MTGQHFPKTPATTLPRWADPNFMVFEGAGGAKTPKTQLSHIFWQTFFGFR